MEFGADDKIKYGFLLSYGLLLIVFGLFMDSPVGIMKGLYKIVLEPDFLITDYIGVGGLGAAFVNSGCITLVAIYMMYRLKIDITGASISTVWLMSGFAFFGKNIFNIWFIIFGVWLYSKFQKDKFIKYVYVALFGTSLSPMMTQIMFGMNMSTTAGILLGAMIGICIGFILSPLAAYLMRVHQGFNLYNIGFTAGIIGTMFMSVFRSYGIDMQIRTIWTEGNNMLLGSLLVIMFLVMIGIGYLLNSKSFKGLKNIYHYSGRLVTDFVILEGFAPTLLNMGINGLCATLYVLLVKGDINGPTIGGIFTIVGFSSMGKHLRNMVPIVVGVTIASYAQVWSINDPVNLITALLSTTLAPLSGSFGWKYGLIAGFLHSAVVVNVGYLHGGFNLYNNGFAGGLVAATLIPIIEAIRKDD